ETALGIEHRRTWRGNHEHTRNAGEGRAERRFARHVADDRLDVRQLAETGGALTAPEKRPGANAAPRKLPHDQAACSATGSRHQNHVVSPCALGGTIAERSWPPKGCAGRAESSGATPCGRRTA